MSGPEHGSSCGFEGFGVATAGVRAADGSQRIAATLAYWARVLAVAAAEGVTAAGDALAVVRRVHELGGSIV